MVLFTDSAKRRASSMGVAPDELAADLLNSVVAIDSVIACNPDLLGETASVLLHLQANLAQSAAQRSAAQREGSQPCAAQRSAADCYGGGA